MRNPELWVWLQLALGAGSAKPEKLLGHFGGIKGVYGAAGADLAGVPGLTKRELGALCDKSLQKSEGVVGECLAKGYNVLTPEDPEFPESLQSIYARPCALYVEGDGLRQCCETLAVSIVGTRQVTEYGFEAATRLAMGLAAGGAAVVSGLARGVDGAAHRGALKGGGVTVAVIGCGLDVNYPAAHAELKRLIARHGAVVSEYPPGSRPDPYHFPLRNRIIAGLSRGTAVVEAGSRSGALITASLAMEMGRDVFAVPGSIFSPMSEGPNRLIADGAKPVCRVADIFEEYPGFTPHTISGDGAPEDRDEPASAAELREAAPAAQASLFEPEPEIPQGLSPVQESLYAVLPEPAGEPAHVDDLALRSNLELRVVLAALTSLEIQGLAQSLPGRRYRRVSRQKKRMVR